MATNKLMEAAADILSGSKKAAPAEPMHKMDGGVVDLGGPTPQDSKPTDNSNKIDATKAAKSATAPTTKPSAASSDTQNHPVGGKKVMGEEDEVYEYEDEVMFQEDLDSLWDDSTISEEFKQKAATIFEARVLDRVAQIQEEMESHYEAELQEAVESIAEELTTKVDDYLNYVVEQWMQENEIAIESGLRAELTEEFIVGLRNLFAEHYIDVPDEKIDLVDELAEQVVTLESKLDEEIERNIEYKKALIEAVKNEIANEVCDGLTATQAAKIKSLAESVDFSTEEEYKDKLDTIRENYFPSGVKKANAQQLHESFETDDKPVVNDPFVAAVSQAISKTKI